MKKTMYLLRLRTLVFLILFILGSFSVKAQLIKNPSLTWDREVGCIKYDEKNEKSHTRLDEEVEESVCIRVCSNSTVKYNFSANYLTRVQWTAVGGVIESSSNGHAQILWGDTGMGSLILHIFYEDGTEEFLTTCIDKIASPKALFSILSLEEGQKTFCENVPIFFKNKSTANGGSDLVHYFWEFGDGNTSSTFEPSHTYEASGNYQIKLTVTNSCNCSQEYTMKIRVTKSEAIEISCPSVICEKGIATYTVNDKCGGEWRVIGGSILSSNQTSVEVSWDHPGDLQDGFGYIHYRSSCGCPAWSTVKVPVIVDEITIKGPEIVCEGSQTRFSMPQWPATEFTWTIDDDPNHPMLIHTDQRNEIIIDGTTAGRYRLDVQYRNTLIDEGECRGKSTIIFRVKERPQIETNGSLINCQDTSMSFRLQDRGSAYWKVRLGDRIVSTYDGDVMRYDFKDPGIYFITAEEGGCESEPLRIEIIATPIIQGNITGPERVCLNTPYIYEFDGIEPGFIYVWNVEEGQIIGNNTGRRVEALFTSSSAQISVVKQIVKEGQACNSEPITFAVKELVFDPKILNASNLTEFCPSSSTTFHLELDDVVPDHIEWSIKSSTNATNFGSILNGINDPTATVSFNEVTSSNTGILTAKIIKCGTVITRTFPIKIIDSIHLEIGDMPNICPGQSPLYVPITITPAVETASIQVFIEGESVGYANYTNGDSSISIPNRFRNESDTNLTQNLTLTLEMCNFKISATKELLVYPKTSIQILPLNDIVVCPETYGSIELTSTVSTGVTASTLFYWYKVGNSNPIPGFNSSTLLLTGANPGGSYYVRIVDINGCTVQSNTIKVIENCSPNSGGPGEPLCIIPGANVTITESWSACNEVTAVVNINGNQPDRIVWQGRDSQNLPIAPQTQGTTIGKFNTTKLGPHYITVYLYYDNCVVIKDIIVTKNYEAKLKVAVTCNGDGTYKVTLHNNSLTFRMDTSQLRFQYSGVGVPANASGNSVVLPRVSPGTYNYTLTVSAPNKPACSITVPVTLDVEPSTLFTVTPLSYCSDELISLTIPNFSPDHSYEWIFNGTSFKTKDETTLIQIPEPGLYPIKLRLTTLYGCTYETPVANQPRVRINKAVFNNATINPTPANYCVGNATALSVSIGNNSPSTLTNAIWMSGNEQVGTGMTYLPVQSGSYWPILIDQNGCKSYNLSASPNSYILRTPPFASISGSTSVCFGEEIVLTGITTEDDVEYYWQGRHVPATHERWMQGNQNKLLRISDLPPGTYEYTFHVRSIHDQSCESSFSLVVRIQQQVPTPTITATVINCNPYTLQLTAHGPDTGIYTWSNGSKGRSISVLHGGAYSVTYTETTGCSATGSIQAPHDPGRVLWVVPSGCYSVCDPSYLIGPLGTYQNFKWEINETTYLEGSPTVLEQGIVSNGGYQLSIGVENCVFTSNIPQITRNFKKCPPTACQFKSLIEIHKVFETGYYGQITIYNPYATTTINLSSYYGYGLFSPNVFVLNPGSNTFSITFIGNSTFHRDQDEIILINGTDCTDQIPIRIQESKWVNTIQTTASIKVSPNPSTDQSKITFDLGTDYNQAQVIRLYDAMGVQRYHQKIQGKTGEITLQVGHLAKGIYLITLEADNQIISTEKLVKN